MAFYRKGNSCFCDFVGKQLPNVRIFSCRMDTYYEKNRVIQLSEKFKTRFCRRLWKIKQIIIPNLSARILQVWSLKLLLCSCFHLYCYVSFRRRSGRCGNHGWGGIWPLHGLLGAEYVDYIQIHKPSPFLLLFASLSIHVFILSNTLI